MIRLAKVAIAVALLVVAGVPAPLAAQTPSAAAPRVLGTRVRVTSRHLARRTGVLVSLTGDSTVTATIADGGDTVSVSDVTRLELSAGRHRHLVRGAILGTIAGTAIGFAAYEQDKHAAEERSLEAQQRIARDCSGEVPAYCLLLGIGASIGSIITPEKMVYGGVAGLIAGTSLGVIHHEHWRRQSLRTIEHRVGVVMPMDRHRTGVGLVARF